MIDTNKGRELKNIQAKALFINQDIWLLNPIPVMEYD